MLEIEFHPYAYSELQLSRDWYEEKATNLGDDFLDEIERSLKSISESPTTWPWYDKGLEVRRFLVHRFPYAVLYRVTPTTIQVIAQITSYLIPIGHPPEGLSIFCLPSSPGKQKLLAPP